MKQVLAVVVTFHPEKETIDNIISLLEQVAHIIVIDNESSVASKKSFNQLASLIPERISFIFNPVNEGVAKAFNQGLHWGLTKGFQFFLLMDQDSRAQAGMVAKLLKTLKEMDPSLSLVGPRHEDFSRADQIETQDTVQAKPLLITSGSLWSKDLIARVGLYDERLFIDHVDHDFCLRLARLGGKSWQVNSAVLLHRFGAGELRSFLGKKFFLQSYSPFRRFYMTRNRVILYRRYGMFNGLWFWMDFRSALKDLIKLLFFEPDKKLKLKSLLRGLRDGLAWQETSQISSNGKKK